jgi:hypothetical protein
MEDIGRGQDSQGTDKSLRKPYQRPQLTNLGQIQSLVQMGNAVGNDGCTNGAFCAS